jgi:glycosyltransferase involved in cell wall biosynthesis
VITNDINGGSRELIEDGVSGYILESDVKLISEKIIKLTGSSVLREQMGIKGSEIVKSKFTINRMAEDFNNLYKDYLIS